MGTSRSGNAALIARPPCEARVSPHFSSVISWHFFRNDAVNRVNLHSGIQALAQGAGAIFFLVFMLRAGVSVPAALTAQAAILAGRFLIRPIILPLAKRWGLSRW